MTQMDNFEFEKVPFGLVQAPAPFQQLINDVLKGLSFAFVYLIDILIFSGIIERYLEHLLDMFDRLRKAILKLRRKKCNFSNTKYII